MSADSVEKGETLDCSRRANLFVVRRGGRLPPFCVMCGALAPGEPIKRTLTRFPFPLWIGALLLLAGGLLPPIKLVGFVLMAVSFFTRQSVVLDIPLCEGHRNNQDAASLLGRILFFGGLAVTIAVSIVKAPPLLILMSCGLTLAGLFLMSYGRLRAMAIESQFCVVNGASLQFVARLPEESSAATAEN